MHDKNYLKILFIMHFIKQLFYFDTKYRYYIIIYSIIVNYSGITFT